MSTEAQAGPVTACRLEPFELEFLERFVDRGEALLHQDCLFYAAEGLLKNGLARVATTYVEGMIRRIEPTPEGRELARLRRAERRERLRRRLAPPFSPAHREGG